MGLSRSSGGALVASVVIGLFACSPASSSTVASSRSGSLESERALRDVAERRVRLADRIDPHLGVAYALRRDDASGEDPRADANGTIAETERICDLNDPRLDRLRDQLAMHVLPEFDYAPLVCSELVCSTTGPMEFATSLRFEFEPSDRGLRLVRILEVEDVSIVEEVARARWAEAEIAATSLPSRCD